MKHLAQAQLYGSTERTLQTIIVIYWVMFVKMSRVTSRRKEALTENITVAVTSGEWASKHFIKVHLVLQFIANVTLLSHVYKSNKYVHSNGTNIIKQPTCKS
jgi:hypothetical protein